MTFWEILFCVASVCAILASTVYALSTRRILRHLEQMLDDAFHGKFQESRYDESRLSRLEVKLAQFLSASALSRAQLNKDRQALTETIGDISHQTKTPITNILLYTQLLHEHPLSPEVQELAEQVGHQAEKLDSLVQSLVKTSRLETGVIALMPVPSGINELLGELEQSYLPAALRKGIELHIAQPVPFSACFDLKWTAEALGNIIDNAIKYTPEGGCITVSCQKYDLFCRVDITDTGLGIPETEQANIFQRFYRGAQMRQENGVGIGLYLARQIISGEGGYIKVQSIPGKGSTFSVFLPA